jgi:hypothetical protein
MLHENKYGTDNVYEIGETGVRVVKAPDSIIAQEGKKQVSPITSSERER